MKHRFWILVALMAVLPLIGSPMFAQSVASFRLYEQRCTTCHGNPGSPKNVPDGLQLLKMSPEAVYAVLSKSATHPNIPGVSDDDKRVIASYLGGRKVGMAEITDAKKMSNQCPSNPPMGDLSASPSWNGWGLDASNSRFQPAKTAGISAEQVPQLKLKWAFGFPATEEVYGQPTVAGGRVFIGVDSGAVYSIDAATGCVYWSFQADAGVRNAMSVAALKKRGSANHAVYFGDIKANLYRLDAETGKLVWKVKVDENSVARITGAPTLYGDRLYVPVASSEERAAGISTTYPCCTFRGSVVAVDTNTGKQVWKTYIIPNPPKPMGKNPNGVQRWGPSGGGVWNSPTIDAKNHALYVGTGDAYTEPAPNTTDSVMAINMDTGKVLWSIQDTENDAWLAGCNPQTPGVNCPKELGPDYDFGSSPILRTLPDGRRILVAGQKSGMVWAHDPDKKGALVWKAQLVDKLALGMITFGGAADDQAAYFGLRTGGVASVELATGDKKWFTPEDDSKSSIQLHGQTAAVAAIPGAIFSGGWDGMLRAYSTVDGRLLWEYDTAHEYQTVNGVSAKGGSMGAPGPVVAGGMLFAGSGYVFGAGTSGNVLLVFAPN
jgi:polyvinyl alcohol dehydrogenase (cytochrome)